MLRGSIPPTGLPLPFVSAGSTSLIAFLGAVGLLLACNKNSTVNDKIFVKSDNELHWVFIRKKKDMLNYLNSV